jgi:hypothetical protein
MKPSGDNDMNNLHPAQRLRYEQGARRYAAGDKSDPFAYARAMTHMNSGLCGYTPNGKEEHYYDAVEGRETRRLPAIPPATEGEEYTVPSYSSRKRI